MGGGGKKKHAPSPVSPAGHGLEPTSLSEALAVPPSATAFAEALGGVAELEDYAALADVAETALALHEQAVAEGWSPQLASEALKDLKAATATQLGALPLDELQALAAEHGFEHPTLVGWGTDPGDQHPLVHWLDPVYPPTSPSKLAIQAKAAERCAKLAAGESLHGLTLADLHTLEAALGAPLPGAWQASPAQVVGALTAVNEALAGMTGTSNAQSTGLAALVAAENRLMAASCPDMPASDLAKAKAAAKATVDKALGQVYGGVKAQGVAALVADRVATGSLGQAPASLLTRNEQLSLLRLSTPGSERQALLALASERDAQLTAFKDAHAAYGGVSQLGAGAAPAEVSAWADATGSYIAARKQVAGWASGVAQSQEITALVGHGSWPTDAAAAQLTKDFRTWAKGQKLDQLRATAEALGMQAPGASRAQVQNYIAATWDPSLNKAQIQAAVMPKPAKGPAATTGAPPTPKPPPTPATVTAKTAPLSAGASLAAPPRQGSFADKHLQIVGALKAHQAVAADLPARPTPTEVEGWTFGPGHAAALGGAHQKSVHPAPDGGAWMFKPDKSGGARAHAEAAAADVLHRVGIPTVGVYVRTLGGKVGSIQPLVSGATTLGADPKGWSQAEADAIVRYHVAAWAVDHDGNHTNVLRTPSGGLLPVDQGQAFKFFGQDRLDVDYHPNGSYGTAPPVFHQAYKAGKAAGLGTGVCIRPEAALPVIRAFEAMPDVHYRALLAKTASEGVKGGAHWVGPMRKAAQKRLGSGSVADADVADEFVRHAVERKKGLRKTFSAFFASLGFAGADKIEKVA